MDENWIKILETIKDDEVLEYLKEEFDKNNIKYKIELEEKWEGIRVPKYIGKFVVYIQNEYKNKSEKILNQYYKNNETVIGEVDKLQEIKGDETEIESKKTAKKQKIVVKIYLGIVICMVIALIVAAELA